MQRAVVRIGRPIAYRGAASQLPGEGYLAQDRLQRFALVIAHLLIGEARAPLGDDSLDETPCSQTCGKCGHDEDQGGQQKDPQFQTHSVRDTPDIQFAKF